MRFALFDGQGHLQCTHVLTHISLYGHHFEVFSPGVFFASGHKTTQYDLVPSMLPHPNQASHEIVLYTI